MFHMGLVVDIKLIKTEELTQDTILKLLLISKSLKTKPVYTWLHHVFFLKKNLMLVVTFKYQDISSFSQNAGDPTTWIPSSHMAMCLVLNSHCQLWTPQGISFCPQFPLHHWLDLVVIPVYNPSQGICKYIFYH